MSLWGTGVFEGDEQKELAAGICEPLLKRIVAILSRPDTLRRRTSETIDLMLCRMDLLTVLVSHISTQNKNELGRKLFPCQLPEPEVFAEWRRRFFEVWEAHEGEWEAGLKFQQARRAEYEGVFDRLAELVAAQQDQRDEVQSEKRAWRRGRRA
jgi:hypothetical protein